MSLTELHQLEQTAVNNFRTYLRIPSVHPDIDYDECIKWLEGQAKSLDLSYNVYEVAPRKPVFTMTWPGTDPSKPSILLNSHMDVVPVFAEKWTYPPFDAHMDAEGNIYARGSQDMKCVGVMFIEAVRRLKRRGERLKRTVHLSFVPDEEIAGKLGMRLFVKTDSFKTMNVGFGLDEGICSPENAFYVFSGERYIWQMEIKCPGNPGHGSLLIDNTAGEKLQKIVDKFYEFRTEQKRKMKDENLEIGDVFSINLTKIWGGVQTNVIPDEMTAVFDVRIPPSYDPDEVEAMFNKWCKEAGEGVHIVYEQKSPRIESTKCDDSNPYWLAFKRSCDKQGLTLRTSTFPGGTDSRYLRELGIPAIGFTPANNTPILLHDHNEYLNKDIFLKGIVIYMDIITEVANI